jgi:ATP-dependent RNA helicase RhlE
MTNTILKEEEIEKIPYSQLKLDSKLQQALDKLGFTHPTPIQQQIIPDAMTGRDVLGCSETGSGKTAAFSLPVLHQILAGGDGLRCIILEPTRELAMQVHEVLQKLTEFTNLKTAVIFGGVPVKLHINAVKKGVDIIVATPGRLIDLTWQGVLDFSYVKHIVIDEVDRMFDMGFIDDVEKILSYMPKDNFQLLGFSATLSNDVRRLLDPFVKDPAIITVGRNAQAAEGIEQRLYPLAMKDKARALVHILREEKTESAIIFTETKVAVDRVYNELRNAGFSVKPFHSGYDQVARFDILRMFRERRVKILVATNVAARGLDISGISHIINYEVPRNSEDYVHRIGRSARGNAEGIAITLAANGELYQLQKIEKLLKSKIPRVQIPGMTLSDLTATKSGQRGGPRSGSKPFARGARGNSSRQNRPRRKV